LLVLEKILWSPPGKIPYCLPLEDSVVIHSCTATVNYKRGNDQYNTFSQYYFSIQRLFGQKPKLITTSNRINNFAVALLIDSLREIEDIGLARVRASP